MEYRFQTPITRNNEGKIVFRAPLSKVETRSFYPSIQQWYTGIWNRSELNEMVDSVTSRIANTISVLPIEVMAPSKNGWQNAYWHPVARLLEDPCIEETKTHWLKLVVKQLLCQGNCYIKKFYSYSTGQVSSLQLLDPTKVMVDRDPITGTKRFHVQGVTHYLTEQDIIHIAYYGEAYDGTVGKSPLTVHKKTVENNEFIREFIAMSYHNGTGSRLMVTLGDKFSAGSAQLNQLIQEFNEFYMTFVANSSNQGMPLITPPNTTIGKLEVDNLVSADAYRMLEQSDEQICRMFNVPPQVLMPNKNTYGSLSQMMEDYLFNCIQPLANHICESLAKGLLNEEETVRIRFSFDDMLETDVEKKQNRLMSAFHGGLITLNEFREAMHLSSIANKVEGESRWIPANLIPLTEDNINSILAKSKLALQEAEGGKDSAEKQEDKQSSHNGEGYDKMI